MKHIVRLSGILLLNLVVFVSATWAASSRAAVIGDYDGDGRSDIVVARQINGGWMWFVRYATGQEAEPFMFGLAASADTEDQLLAGDYNGDGRFQAAVVREEADGGLYWYTRGTNGDAERSQWGLTGDIPLTGYFGESSGKLSQVVVRNIGGGLTWFINNGTYSTPVQWGLVGDDVFTADVDGDGIDEVIAVRDIGGGKYWFIKNLVSNSSLTVGWGLAGDEIYPPADFNGDGSADLLVSRSVNGARIFYIRYYGLDSAAAQSVQFGASTDQAYVGFFTGSLAEIVLLRTATSAINLHYVRFALQNFVASVSFGLPDDSIVTPSGRALGDFATASTGSTGAGFGSVCAQTIGVSSGTLWKPSSQHTNDARENKPLILFNRSIPSISCLNVYASNGEKVTQLGVYEYNGHYGGRWYSGHGCGGGMTASQMAADAEGKSGSSQVYVEKSPGVCVGPIDPRSRTGGLA